MSFPRYPKYKPSGVEWLGELPEHWNVAQSRRLFACRNERSRDGDQQLTASQEHGIITQEDFVRLEGRRVVEVLKGADILKHVEPNDFVISMRSFQGGLEHSRVRGCISSAYVMLSVRAPLHEPFFAHLFKSQSYIQALQATTNLVRDGQAMRYNNFTLVALPLVPLSEQRAIAAFLDRETAKIDALIAEQENLIELLAEKRQAVISHAVTKGLNPAAPMKPSGIEWLGDVPAHWQVLPIRMVARLESGHTPSRTHPEYWENCTVPWFSLADVWQIREAKRDVIIDTSERISELGIAHSAARKLPPGTVMLSRTASVGFSAIMGVEMATTQDFANWVCGPRLTPEYLLRVFRAMKPDFARLMMGSTHNTIYMPDIQSMRCAVPPLTEQADIVAFIAKESARIDQLSEAASRAADLLRERRSALISAAVTGQIDVRNAVPEPAA